MNIKESVPAEFDSYAHDYVNQITAGPYRLTGVSFQTLMHRKARWLVQDLARHPLIEAATKPLVKILDFGCGTGEFLFCLKRLGLEAHFSGCDVSAKMLAEARKRWAGEVQPEWHVVPQATAIPLPSASFSIIIACCVYHHIPPPQHVPMTVELVRLLRPGGRLVVFDHNPFNPLTRWISKGCPVDRNAVLVPASAMQKVMCAAGLQQLRRAFLVFVPPAWTWFDRLEDLLASVPMGAQYVMVGEKGQDPLTSDPASL
jgi:ubiquinone/menaquinone biosynthesis C-methylase UbiE